MVSAFILDLDGTLVDLLGLHWLGFRTVAVEGWGMDFPREDVEVNYGKSAEEIAKAFFEKHNVTGVDYKAFARKRRDVVLRKLREGYKVKMLPGAMELLKELKAKKVKTALATSNSREMGEAILSAAGLKDYFQAFVYREDIKKGKPAPDIFLKAAKMLNVRPEECVVVEDSVYGVAAGKAAKMKVVAVATGTQPKSELLKQKPDLVLETLEAGLENLSALIRS